MEFLEYISVDIGSLKKVESGEDETSINLQREAIDYFGKQFEVDELIMKRNKKMLLVEKFNGHMFLELGVPDKEIGIKMCQFKEAYKNFDQLLEHSSKEEMFSMVRLFLGK
mgnify:CR=1 FL=1